MQLHSFLFNAELLQYLSEQGYAPYCFVVALPIMAVTGAAATDEHAISPRFQGFQNKEWTQSATAHRANNMDVGGTFQSCNFEAQGANTLPR
jgi:hypothetical protein